MSMRKSVIARKGDIMNIVLENRKVKTGYEAMGYFNMSSAYLVLQFKERATPIEWMLFTIYARQRAMIERIGDTVIELGEFIGKKLDELEKRIANLE